MDIIVDLNILFIYLLGNRRLDEWVTIDRIDFNSTPKENNKNNPGSANRSDQPDRKITRNQKRKHDEINHTPTVTC